MKQISKVLMLALSFLLIGISQAGATSYNFSFIGANISGSGTLETTIDYGTSALVSSGSITVDGISGWSVVTNPSAPDFSVYSCYIPEYDGTYEIFRFDNLLFNSSPSIDNYGLLFLNIDTQTLLNIWYVADTSLYSSYTYHIGDGNYLATNEDVQFNLNSTAPVPEPATMLLFGTGLFGIASFRKRFLKK
jgi:hypothetical protein